MRNQIFKIQIYKKIIEILLKNFHKGQENAVTNKQIQRLLGTNKSMIRKAIRRLRIEGTPICFNENGYYYAESISDIKDTIIRLHCMQTGIQNVEMGLMTSINL